MKQQPSSRNMKAPAFFVFLAFFWLIRIFPWATAELWYDELLTLQLFANSDSFWHIFRDYRIANNHFLCSALEWLWLNLSGVSWGNSWLLRLPSILCGLGTLSIVFWGWRRFLGMRLAMITACVMAGSAVFGAFSYQLRGYSLVMLLGAWGCLLAHCSLEREKHPWPEKLELFLAGVLPPLVMPPAAMVPCVLACGMAWSVFRRTHKVLQALRAALPMILGMCLGTGYYLTLLSQLHHNSLTSGGWPNAWALLLQLALAIVLHLGMLNAGWLVRIKPEDTEYVFSTALLVSSLGALLAVLLLPSAVHMYPFPRVFLGLLPVVTYAAALRLRRVPWIEKMNNFYVIALALMPGLFMGILGDSLCRMRLQTRDDHIPQSLCWQYYRGNSPATEAVLQLKRHRIPQEIPVVVHPIDSPAFEFYFRLYGLKNPVLPSNQIGAKESAAVGKCGKMLLCTLVPVRNSNALCQFQSPTRYFTLVLSP